MPGHQHRSCGIPTQYGSLTRIQTQVAFFLITMAFQAVARENRLYLCIKDNKALRTRGAFRSLPVNAAKRCVFDTTPDETVHSIAHRNSVAD